MPNDTIFFKGLLIAHAIVHSAILRLMRVNPFKESARFLATEIRFGSLSSDRSRSVERSALHPKVFETRLPSTLSAEIGNWLALCTSLFLLPQLLRRRNHRSLRDSAGPHQTELPIKRTIRSSLCLTLRTVLSYTSIRCWTPSSIGRTLDVMPIARESPSLGRQRVAKTSKGGSRHCARSPFLAGSGSARHTCLWVLHMSPRYRIRVRVSGTGCYNWSCGR